MKKHISKNTPEYILWASLIFVVAMTLRLIFLFEFQAVPIFSHPFMDMAYHHDWATAIARGEEFIKGPFFRAPLYPIFLGAVYFLFGDNPWVIRIIQALMGSFSAALVYLIARRLFDNRTAALAGIISAGWGTVIFYDAQLLIPTLVIFLDLAALYYLVKALEKNDSKYLAAGGIILGLSAVARPTILLFAGVLVFWMFFIWRKQGWQFYSSKLVIFLFALVLPILPVTIYNYVKSGEFTLIGTYGGLNFYIGNNLEADGVSARLPEARSDWWGMMEDAQRMAEYDVGHKLTPAQQSDYWTNKTLNEIIEYPGHFIALTFKKFLILCGGVELANNFDLYFFTHRTMLMKLLIWPDVLFFPWGIIFPLAVAGMLLASRKDYRVQLLLLFLIAYVPSVVLFFVTSRYRLPMAPLLAVFAAVAVTTFIYKRRKLTTRKKTAIISLTVALLVFCNLDIYKLGRESDMHGLQTMATIYKQEGKILEAERYYRLAIQADPHRYEPVNDLAMLLDAQGRSTEAVSLLEQGVKYMPEVFILKYNLAYLYLSQKRYEEAIPLLEQAITLNPVYVPSYNNLGFCHMQLGRFDQARKAFHEALKIDPLFALSYENIGKIFYNEGQLDSARVYFGKALNADPSNAEAGILLESLKTK